MGWTGWSLDSLLALDVDSSHLHHPSLVMMNTGTISNLLNCGRS
jgi:hypothetical protein